MKFIVIILNFVVLGYICQRIIVPTLFVELSPLIKKQCFIR